MRRSRQKSSINPEPDNAPESFVLDPDYVPPPLPPEVEEEVQRILDAAARRILEERIRKSESGQFLPSLGSEP